VLNNVNVAEVISLTVHNSAISPPILPTNRHCARYKFFVSYCIILHIVLYMYN